LPPLLPPPGPPPPPLPPAPGGPAIAYDPGYFYIPDRAPDGSPDSDHHFLHRWWFDPSAELAWTSTRPAPQTLRLRPPDVFGRTARLNVPLNGDFTRPFQAGFGLSVGRWLGEERLHAIDGNLMVTGNSRSLDGFAPGTAVLFPDGSNHSAPTIVRFPAPLDALGTVFPASAETTFVSLDLNYRLGLLIARDWRIDALAGYRFAYLEDQLYLGDNPEGGESHYAENRFRVSNAFHGGQIGLAGTYRGDSWYTEGTVKVAYGGVTTTNTATGAFLYPHPRAWVGYTTQAAFLPSLNVRVGYQLSDSSRVFAGYSFQYLTHVGRFGDAFGCGCGQDDFWIQSLGLGLEFGY
jgi:hypothetical protein